MQFQSRNRLSRVSLHVFRELLRAFLFYFIISVVLGVNNFAEIFLEFEKSTHKHKQR